MCVTGGQPCALPIYAREPAQTSDRDRRRSSTADTDGDSARTGAEGKVSHRQREGLRTVRRTRRTSNSHSGSTKSRRETSRQEEHTTELQSRSDLVCSLLL